MSVCNARHRICHSRSCSDQRHAKLSSKFRMSMCHVDRRPFIANVDDLNADGIAFHPDWHDVAATKTEDSTYATGLQSLSNEPRDASQLR